MDPVPISGSGVIAGKYELIRLVAQGGMGAVYEGRHTATRKRCAVKLLSSPELSQHPDIVRRFFREARASSVVESDHIVDVFDSGVDSDSGHPYMVMELLAGEDLEKAIKRVGPIEPWVAAKLMLQATTGLAKAHEMGVFHRDIKPANVFLSLRDSGEIVVKILDFGVAKVRVESLLETSGSLTRTGSLLGTPLYMSPEQTRGASQIDARSDVWSLGVVLFEMLTGSLPFPRAGSFGELMVAILTADLPLLQDYAPWVPPELAELTHRAMSRDLGRRFQNAGELCDALAAILPEGGHVHERDLVGVSDGERSRVAPRLSLPQHDEMLRGTPPTWLTATRLEPRRRSTMSVVMLGGGLGVLAALATGGLMQLGRHSAEAETKPQLAARTPAAIQLPARAPESAPPEEKRPPRAFALLVPTEARVEVDGAPATARDGRVEIRGAVGETRRVKLVRGDASSETRIAITESGLLPDRIELSSPAASSPVRSRHAANKTPSAPRAPEPSAERTAAKPAGALKESTREFD